MNEIAVLSQEEFAELGRAKSELAWNTTCDKIKAARNGAYPPDWFAMVLASGFMARVVSGFGGSTEIRISSF